MKINFVLSAESIGTAVGKLQTALDELKQDVSDCVDILVTEGAEQANYHYGSMATAIPQRDSEDLEHGIVEGHIGVTADSPETAIIAEFGAGDAVIDYDFENKEPVPIYPGSYSELVGSREYFNSLMASGGETGTWHFGGKTYHEVQPRRGLANAKAFIIMNAEDIVKGVIKQ